MRSTALVFCSGFNASKCFIETPSRNARFWIFHSRHFEKRSGLVARALSSRRSKCLVLITSCQVFGCLLFRSGVAVVLSAGKRALESAYLRFPLWILIDPERSTLSLSHDRISCGFLKTSSLRSAP